MFTGEQQQFVTLRGFVCKGEGMGHNFINNLDSQDPILNLLGEKPFPGTLCIRLSKLFEFLGDDYGRTGRGSVKILYAYFQGERVILKWSQESPLNIQLISSFSLRTKYSLIDSHSVQIEVKKNYIRRPSARTRILSFLQQARDTKTKIVIQKKSA